MVTTYKRSSLRHIFYSGTCIPQVPKSIFSHIIFFVAVEIILCVQYALWFPSCTWWVKTIILTASEPLNYFCLSVPSRLKLSSSSFLYCTNYHTMPLQGPIHSFVVSAGMVYTLVGALTLNQTRCILPHHVHRFHLLLTCFLHLQKLWCWHVNSNKCKT